MAHREMSTQSNRSARFGSEGESSQHSAGLSVTSHFRKRKKIYLTEQQANNEKVWYLLNVISFQDLAS